MKHMEESAKLPSVMAETEVLVVGGGPAGLAASIAAAREGVSTMLVERYGFFGGVITQAMCEAIAWYRHEQTIESDGIGCEFERCAREVGGAQDYPWGPSTCLDADMFKYVADKMVHEAGITPLFHCFAVQSIMDGDTIKGVTVESKSGRQAILAKRVIDATGDADIAARAGAPYNKAEADKLMPVTVGFGMSGVDVDRFRGYVKANPTHLTDWAPPTSGKEDDVFSSYFKYTLLYALNQG